VCAPTVLLTGTDRNGGTEQAKLFMFLVLNNMRRLFLNIDRKIGRLTQTISEETNLLVGSDIILHLSHCWMSLAVQEPRV